jgi:hypothetical protein
MNCLEGLIKIKDYCEPTEVGPFLSDFVDVSTVFLAHLANDSEHSGKQYGEQLIRASMEQVWSDLVLTSGNGWSVNPAVYYYENKCRFTDVYTNFGVTLTNFFRSTNSNLYITEIKFKPEVDGDFFIVVENAKSIVKYPATGFAGKEGSILIEYVSTEKQVKIYAEDPTQKFAMLTCQSGGCGSCAAKRGVYIQGQGYNRVSVNAQPSGFIPVAYIACDMDSAICSVVSRHKALFSKAIAYKVGIMVYSRLLISPRLNDTTLNIDSDAVRTYLNTLEAKYRELLWGSTPAYGNAASTGLVKIMQQTFRTMNDQCIICNSQITTATAVF